MESLTRNKKTKVTYRRHQFRLYRKLWFILKNQIINVATRKELDDLVKLNLLKKPTKVLEYLLLYVCFIPIQLYFVFKGGKEHGVPILISEVHPDQPADRSGNLFVGDAILSVNGIDLSAAKHTEAVEILSREVLFIY